MCVHRTRDIERARNPSNKTTTTSRQCDWVAFTHRRCYDSVDNVIQMYLREMGRATCCVYVRVCLIHISLQTKITK